MGTDRILRHSRSWKDLSSLMRKHAHSESPVTPSLKRTSSFGSVGRFSEEFGKDVPSMEEQRIKEREFQQKAGVKRKAVPDTRDAIETRGRDTSPAHGARPRTAHGQLPSFSFSTQELE